MQVIFKTNSDRLSAEAAFPLLIEKESLMKNSESENAPFEPEKRIPPNYIKLGILVLSAVLLFLLAIAEINLLFKLLGLFTFLFYIVLFSRTLLSPTAQESSKPADNEAFQSNSLFDEEVEYRLFALEEANQFFGATLKSGDMFRLVASRINEMIPFSTCVVFLESADRANLRVAYSAGENSLNLKNLEILKSDGLAGKCFKTRRLLFDSGGKIDSETFGVSFPPENTSSIAAPLLNSSEIFGVVQLFCQPGQHYGESYLKLLEAISERISPLMLSSIAFEKNLSNALTDSLTNLPNERALFLVLENQIAESQRYRDERPLSVLTMDIRNFDEINRRFGHSTGDGVLSFAAELIKNQLRRMDFLARTSSDEFLAVLPTANEETTLEILERLDQVFAASPYGTSDGNRIIIQLNYGSATFWQDGETPKELLNAAHIQKRQKKSPGSMKVLPFTKPKNSE